MKKKRKSDALRYHEEGRPGKIEVIPTVATKTQRDLSLAYSPGVAEPCLAIAENPMDVYKYTSKGNLVAVLSNGTAVLGLGDIGPEASKPVMEGKGILFKIFADIDVFDLEIKSKDVEEFITVVKALEPTFGGINLEDISAPECFEIETRLKAETSIPIMHDDQHGTAIISSAALLNSLELVNKKIDQVKIFVSGAGAAAITCAKLYVKMGAKMKNIYMADRHGVIYEGRDNMDPFKALFGKGKKKMTLADAVNDADVYLGLSVAGVLTPELLLSMADNPIVFALANPVPEIDYNLAIKTRDDIIMATGRSDFPNQVNNVLGFPFIFRGALDVFSSDINDEMKMAAAKALADLTKEPVPDIVNMAYGTTSLVFGKDYIIPKPLDPRLLTTISPAVAKAAMDTGVARKPIKDWDAYESELRKRLGMDDAIMRVITRKAKSSKKRVVFSEADNYKLLQAAQQVVDEGIAEPILLGDKEKIHRLAEEHGLELNGIEIVNPTAPESMAKVEEYGRLFFEKRKRRGYNVYESTKAMRSRNYFGTMMVETGEADALISGLQRKYPDTIRPALEIIGTRDDVSRVAGMYIMMTKLGPLFFADTTVNVNPTAQELIDITLLTAQAVKQFNVQPRIAMLSYSNFGSFSSEQTVKMREAVAYMHKNHPKIIVDGEIQANMAFNRDLLKENYPFSKLVDKGANTLIFPTLTSGNIAYKLMQEVGGAEAIGPILMGLKKPVHVLQLGSSVREIVNMVTFAVVDAQRKG